MPVVGSGVRAKNTHYIGNAGPKGINPRSGLPYTVNNPGSGQGGTAADGVLVYRPGTAPATPIPVQEGITLQMISDGTSNTLMIFEIAWNGAEVSPGSFRAWQRGIDWDNDSTGSRNVMNAMNTVKYNGGGNWNDVSMGSNHTNGCNVVYADASVHFLSKNIDLNKVLLPLASRNGDESFDLP